ncbi:MAG: CCA tRNA nucleotidyltransferase [Patescibacteria group bacterium]
MKFDLLPFVLKIINKFEKAGFEIYIVGGAVRDLLSKRFVDDWDFTTDATPEEILKLYPDAFYDNKFGTVGLAHESSPNPYEITTFRREYGYSDKRRPDKVEWGKSLEEDLERRDFTINAMALKIQNQKPITKNQSQNIEVEAELIDIYDGHKDLNDKLIRAVGEPKKRFSEDALRMMRAVRIAAELGFMIDHDTFEAIKMNTNLINKIAKERVRDELLKILESNNPYEGVMILRNSGLMQEILPEMEKTFGVEQKSPGRHHIYDVGTHSLLSLKNSKSEDAIVRLAILIHDIGKPQTFKKLKNGVITFYNHEVVGARMAKAIARRLRFSKKQRDKLWRLVRYHQFTVNEHQTDSAIRRFIRNVTKQYVPDMIDLRVADRLGGGARETSWRLEDFKKRLIEVQKQPFTVHDLKVSGNDVMKVLRLRSGPKVGEVLEKLYEEVVEKKTDNTKKALMKRLKEIK